MAGFFSEELLNEIISATDIVDIVSSYVHLKRSGSSFMGCCPFHKEKTPSFHVSADKQLYHCFGCGAGGSAVQFIMNAEGLDFPDAVKFLADKVGIRIPEEGTHQNEERYHKKQQIYEMNRDAARFFRESLLSDAGKEARDYLSKRGLEGQTIAKFGIGYSLSSWDSLLKHLESKGYKRTLMVEAGLCIMNEKGHVYDRFRGRVMFPIINPSGNIIGFGGRILSGDGAKYMNSPESIVYDKGKNLFALNLAKKSERGYFILVEGYMDVISLHQAGITAAVAGCGTALTREQARLISKSPVYLCYDSDEAGIKACERAAEIFKDFGTKLKVISIPSSKDADEFIKNFGKNAFEELIDKAKTVTEHRIDLLLKGANLDDVAQKIEIMEKAAQIFAGISNAVEREVYVNQLSIKSGISVEAINSEIRKVNSKNLRREVRSEIQKTVSIQNTQAPEKKNITKRRAKSEAGLLSMMAESQKVFQSFKEHYKEESFSYDIHKKIYSLICEFYENNAGGKCSDYLSGNMQGEEKELSAVLMSVQNVDNPVLAAKDFMNVLDDEIFNEKLTKAQNEGNIEAISALLKEKKQKGGK
ncbi:MAG: DNA primase [Clostridia bacterium]|nr:DNA primase [Clostridia bacterium]